MSPASRTDATSITSYPERTDRSARCFFIKSSTTTQRRFPLHAQEMKSGNLEPDASQAEVDVLNRLQADTTANIRRGSSFTAPGVPNNYPEPK